MWHLATSNLAGKRGRSALLVLAVALAVVLTVSIAAGLGTIGAALSHRLGRVAGLSDLQITHRYNSRVDQAVLAQVRAWPEVLRAAGYFEAGITLRNERTERSETFLAQGVDPELDGVIRPFKYLQGRMIRGDDEIVIDDKSQLRLAAELGDKLTVAQFGKPVELTVVGVIERPPLGVLQRRMALITLLVAQELGGFPDQLDEIDIQLRQGVKLEDVTQRYADAIPPGARFHTPASVRANLTRGLDAARLLLTLLTLLVSLSAGFIIFTSMTTAVTERMRELALLRCVGAGRWQIALSQLLTGVLLAGGGAAVGVPLGLACAYLFYLRHSDLFEAGFHPNPLGIALAVGAALLAGLLGAAYPAWQAARVRPLQALSVRAHLPTRRGALACVLLGLIMIAAMPAVIALHLDPQTTFWFYLCAGLPLTLIGYFLLSVPVLIVLGRGLSPMLARVVAVPPALLRQTILTTPFRHGFTGGALMMGLALLLAMWTGGRSITQGWLGNLHMPDAYAHSFRALSEEQWSALQQVPGVTRLCPVTAFPAELANVRFGVAALAPRHTLFVSVDPQAFFDMADLNWVQGDRAEALAKLQRGRAVLVSNEYSQAHGINSGSTITLKTLQGPVDFEVVGVVGSTGLDIAVQFFGIQRAYTEASMSAVFGTRADATAYYNNPWINLVLMSLDPDVPDHLMIGRIRAAVPGAVAGTSRSIRSKIQESLERFIAIGSMVAIASLIIACVGVSNLIVAEIAGRRFEYGVLRAMGAPRGMLGRLILGQTLMIGLVGCVVGSALGIQLAMVGRVFHHRLLGLSYEMHMPWSVAAWGCLAVLVAALLAALPAALSLMRQLPRVLLAAGRGV
ncbi:MAG: FtsX-like permease family protein [Phycisphaeraceae bacterium]